jgi:hypothetical protein
MGTVKKLLCSLLALLLAGCAGVERVDGQCLANDRDLLRLALQEELREVAYRQGAMNIRDGELILYFETVHPRVIQENDFLEHFPSGAARNMVARNSRPGTIPDIGALAGIRSVSPSERKKLFPLPSNDNSLAWNAFYEAFPHAIGLVNMALPGYDQKCNAMVYLEDQGAPTAGEGVVYWFRWDGHSWKITERRSIWAI